jgi:hypothetical protein
MESGAHGCADAALALFEQLLIPSLLEDYRHSLGLRIGGGLFSFSLTVWLGIRRRLGGGLSIEQTWNSCSPEIALRLSPKSKRSKSGVLSGYASGFDNARRSIPLSLVEVAADGIFEEAQALLVPQAASGWFLIDGSSLSLHSTASLKKAFPSRGGAGGPSYWSLVKFVVAHDLETGLAVRPEAGPMYGPDAVSEQELAYRLLERISKGYGVIADRNFGIFQVAWALRDRPMVLRLTDIRAKSMLKGKANFNDDVDLPHLWRASKAQARAHEELKDSFVPGRIVCRKVLGPKGKLVNVSLFTNDLMSSAEDLVRLYTKRWNVETDLRSFKQTLGMQMVGAQSPEMVLKELILGSAAYNIIRTVMALAAQKAGVQPRQLSFARAKGCIEIFAGRGPITDEAIDEMLVLIAVRKLPNRKEQQSYPREVWTRQPRYPARKKITNE